MSSTSVDGGFAGNERFVIERQLGAGSMGAVYLAYDRKLESRVALKVLLSVDGSSVYRFKKEFRALADVTHKNLVTLHELFSEGDRWFFTMQYVEGRDLLTYVHGGRRRMFDSTPKPISEAPPADAASSTLEPQVRGLEMLFPSPLENDERFRAVLVQVVEGLRAVHAAGKLHRDLKPENILVTPEGRVVLLDFGIVIDRQRDIHETLATIIGTPAYMSPEQCRGQGISEATDWYSLGVILYEALTGDVPFDGTPLQVIQRKQEADPAPPSSLVAGVPEDLDKLCLQLLQRNPAARPDGEAILRALRGRRAASIPVPGERKPAEPKRTAFVGRGAQLRELQSALAFTEIGEPVVALVHGAPGIGKSTLVSRFIDGVISEAQTVVLRGRCYERESVPFKAFDNVIDSLSRYLRKLPAVDAARMLPRDLDALAELFPVLKRVEMVKRNRRQRALPADPQEVRKCAFRALKEMFSRIADVEPLVVYIDDLQWSDLDSAQLLGELVTGGDRPALLLLCVYRSGDKDRSPGLDALLGQIHGNASLQLREVAVGVLSAEDSVALAKELLGGAATEDGARNIGFESGGNPQLLTQLVRHVEERRSSGKASRDTARGIISFERVLEQHLGSLSTDARTLLELLSVAARPVPESILALVSSFNIDLSTALSELRAGKLVRGVAARGARSVEVYHDTIREAVVAGMTGDVITSWHRRLAAALEASGAIDLEALTDHLLGAGDHERASLYAARAAAQAEKGLAFEKAARLYGVAAEHSTDPLTRREFVRRWADTLVAAGRGAEAARVYADAAKDASAGDTLELRGLAGVQLLLSGDLDQGLALLAEPLQALGVTLAASFAEASVEAARLWRQLRARGFSFTPRAEADLDEAQLARFDLLWGVTCGLLLHELDRPMPLLTRCVNDALQLGEPLRVVRALSHFHVHVDEPFSRLSQVGNSGALDVAEAVARRLSDVEARAAVAFARGVSQFSRGEGDAGQRELSHAEELYRNHCRGGAYEMRLCRLILAQHALLIARDGDVARPREWLREAELRGDRVSAVRMRIVLAHAGLRADDPEGARAEFDAALQAAGPTRGSVDLFAELMTAGNIALYQADADACRATFYRIEEFFTTPLAAVPVDAASMLLQRTRVAVSSRVGAGGAPAPAADDALRAIEQLGVATMQDDLALLRASIAAARGQWPEALAAVRGVIERYRERSDPPLCGLFALRARGLLEGGAQGQAMVERADDLVARRGIANPRRFSRLLLPGLEEALRRRAPAA